MVTDLQMPEMNGLELVTAIVANHAEIPIVLMTAYGSEALVVDALRHGRAGYVPKSQLADTLADTVQDVLVLLRGNRSHQRLIQSITEAGLQFSLENDAALIDAVVDFVQQLLSSVRFCDTAERLRVGVALERFAMPSITATWRSRAGRPRRSGTVGSRQGVAAGRAAPAAGTLLPSADIRQGADYRRGSTPRGTRRRGRLRRSALPPWIIQMPCKASAVAGWC